MTMFRRILRPILCRLGKHDRRYWTREQCDHAGVMTGIFTPWWCSSCRKQSQIFPKPKWPPETEYGKQCVEWLNEQANRSPKAIPPMTEDQRRELINTIQATWHGRRA